MNVGSPMMPGYAPWNTPCSPIEPEVVPETQEERVESGTSKRKGKRAHKKKSPERPREKAAPQTWSPEESMALAKAWVEVAEDPMEANYQKEKTFWARISAIFHSLISKPTDYRNADSLNGKFRKMRVAVQAFNQIYTRMNHSSGSNDVDMIQRALGEYNATHASFYYIREWEFLKKSSKFHLVVDWDPKGTRGRSSANEPSAKRSKTTSGSTNEPSQGSDARVNVDLNETEVFDLETQEPRYQRPGGRDAAKKAGRAGSSGTTDFTDKFDSLDSKLEGLMEQGRKRIEVEEKKLQAKENKQFNKDMRLLTIDTSSLPEADRFALEEAKRRIRTRYGLQT